MTVVPDDELMKLICDGCGDTVAGRASVLPDAEVVWTFVSEHGWSGSPFATGPHRCPRCSLVPSSGARATHEGAERDEQRADVLGIDYLEEVAVISAAGDIRVDNRDTLQSALAAAVAVRGHALVDLTQAHLIDSTGLGLLVRAHSHARERGALLCLAAPSRFILTVLHTMRLDGIFPIFDSRDEALQWLSRATATTDGTRAAVSRSEALT
ncbi:STAS domain-containing protein [Micromonospora sp. NBC_00898]|uniref:STAS domain-containing protein n=1 Tax=Micromonospora sp. NBC_00898 TaxID=2975981 RepID=UPI00386B768E|nr:STAS domain-containing protein [Micromonospora sp. NBC_00898]